MKTNKTHLTAILALFIVVKAIAQETTLPIPTPRGFTGVRSIGNDIVYLSWFGEKSETKGMANFVLRLYNKNLEEIKTTEVEVSKFSELASSAFTGKYFMFIFVDGMKKTRTMVTLDAEGNVIQKQVEENVARFLSTPDNYPVIHPIDEDEFALVRPVKDKKFGFILERIDKDLVSKWTQNQIPEDAFWTVADSKVDGGKLYLLKEENPNRASDYFQFSVQAYGLEDGEQVFSTDLNSNEDGGAPAFIRVTPRGEVATGGMYFKKNKYNDKNSEGIFMAVVGKDGELKTFSKRTWDSLKDKIQGEFSSALLGGKTKIMVEDVVRKNEGGYVVITEQFKKANNANFTGSGAAAILGSVGSSSNGPEIGFTVLDFVLFHYDDSGELTNIQVVSKQNKEARISGKVASDKGLAVANYMYGQGFFCYREVIQMNGKQIIAYRNDDGLKSKMYFLPLGSVSTEGIPEIDMDAWVSEKLNKLGKFAKATGNGQYSFNSDSPSGDYNLYKGAHSFGEGQYLMFDYNRKDLKIWIQKIQ
jgi:hypothetical protein